MMPKNNIPVVKEKNKSIRLKVTDKCPWDCTFCHKEGGWGIEDVQWNSATEAAFRSIKDKMGFTEVHYTGGEPTTNRHLEALTAGLVSMGLTVKTTSNGQVSEERLKQLIDSGLRSFNFSIISLDPGEFVSMQKKTNLLCAQRMIAKQRKIILKAKELGTSVKINTVISTEKDIQRALKVYNFAKENKIVIRFLNDLGKGNEAIKVIRKMVEETLKSHKVKEKITTGSSAKTSYYKDCNGFDFAIKEIQENKLKSLCKGCYENCTEQFYGVRLEQKEGRFFVRLCIQINDPKSYLPLERFLDSEQLREINAFRKAA